MKKMLYVGIAACSLTLFSCKDATEAAKGPDKTGLKAAEALNLAKSDLTSGKIASFWDAFPASYQKDIEGITHDFAGKVDAEVYNEAIKTLGSVNSVFKNNKDVVFEMIMANVGESEKKDAELFQENIGSITALVDKALSTNVKDADSLKKLNIAEMTAKVQPDLVKVMEFVKKIDPKQNPVLEAEKGTFSAISEETDKAVVALKMGDGEPDEENVIKFEDRWIPEKMKTEWPEMIKKASEGIKEVKITDDQKKEVLEILKSVQEAAKEAEGAKTKEDLDAVLKKHGEKLGPVIFGLMMGAGKFL